MSDQSDQIKPKPAKSRAWVRALLFTSLALNLLIVGTIGGAFWRHAPDRRAAPDESYAPLRELGYGAYGRALSKEDRREISQALSERSDMLRTNRADFRQQMRSFLAALRATPFDIGAIENVIATQQSGLFERHELGEKLLLERLGAMSDAERQQFAERLERSLRRRRD